MTHRHNVIVYNSLESLEMDRDYIRVEAFSLDPIINKLVGVLPDLKRNFDNLLHFTDDKHAKITRSPSEQKVLAYVKSREYAELRTIKVFIPQGMQVSYNNILEVLQPIVKHLTCLYRDILQPYAQFLAQMATHVGTRNNTMDYKKAYDTLEHDREDRIAQLAACFARNSVQAEAPYSQAFQNNSEWVQVIDLAKKLTDEMNSIDRNLIQNCVKECSQYLDILYHNLQTDPNKKASHEAATHLSDGAYQIARELEFYSLAHYRLMTVTGSLDNTINRLIKND